VFYVGHVDRIDDDDDDVYLDRIAQHKPKTIFHMSNIDQPEKA
jgi:hypothetical protein